MIPTKCGMACNFWPSGFLSVQLYMYMCGMSICYDNVTEYIVLQHLGDPCLLLLSLANNHLPAELYYIISIFTHLKVVSRYSDPQLWRMIQPQNAHAWDGQV